MKQVLHSVLLLALVASMAASSQAEICPMKLQSGQTGACGASMGIKHHHAAQTASGHDCCPRSPAHHTAPSQCPPVELSACMSGMTCCSLDPQPIQSSLQVVAIEQPITFGTIKPPLLPLSRAGMMHATPLPTPGNAVFRLKDDLRI